MESLVYQSDEQTSAHLRELPSGTVGVFSSRAPDKQTPNEDSAGLITVNHESAVLVVADGMGGARSGEKASKAAIESVVESVQQAVSAQHALRTAILNGFEQANSKVQSFGVGAGTTLAVVEITGSTIRPYHAGDSVILLIGKRGKVKFKSIAHSPTGYAVEAGLLNEAEAMRHEERHIISNVVGSPDMRIEIGAPVEMTCGDTLLIASDGLTDNLSVEVIADYIRKGKLEIALENLAKHCQSQMTANTPPPSKPDDLTILAYRMN